MKARREGFPSIRNRKGMAIVGFAVILLMIIPMVGLAIDASLLFITKARLQAAVDGAVLAGARALARGDDSPTQTAAAQAEAQKYVRLNFPNGYFFSQNLSVPTPAVDLSSANQRSVLVNATVSTPALFERFLGYNLTSVAATAKAIRRDVNVAMVVDRSGSLQASGSCGALKQAAVNFVGKFASGRDNVGLITFASSSWIDFPVGTDFQTAIPNISTILNNIVCSGSTSSAQALWQGYQQLAGLGQSGALNVILFFTDGQPTGVVMDMAIAAGSPCSQHPTIRGLLSTFSNSPAFFGLLSASVGPQPIVNGDLVPAPNSTGCTYMNGWAYDGSVHNMTNLSDFAYSPSRDIWGNSADTSFQAVTHDGGGHPDLGNGANGYSMALNAADNAALRIRNGTVDPSTGKSLSGIYMYSIGLGNAPTPASPIFLERVSNDLSSPIYDSTKPQGRYIPAPTAADLNTAFQAIASEILRLAK